ncbi:MAG: CaiB/BaiF CoA transferase family protein [Halolamina sp.]
MNDDSTGPLDGVTVLDASRVLAGPFCGMQLGDLGADVIKVERPDGGDQTRHWTPPAFGEDAGSYYASINRNKRSITLNLGSEAGRETFRDLAAEADVVLENFRVGKAAEWGIDYETIRESNPGVVFCSITGYGQTGPLAERPAYDLMMQAEAGMMSITGEEGRPPVRVGVAVADLAAGMYATQSILAALFRREFTGGADRAGAPDDGGADRAGAPDAEKTGERIDVSLFDSLLAWLSYMATDAFASGESPTRMGSRHPNIAPYQAFETADGYVVVACASEAIWYRLCEALDRPDLVDDHRFEVNEKRVENRDELEAILTQEFADFTVDEVVELLQTNDVPVGRIRDVLDAFDDPQVEARDMRQRVPHPTAGEVQLPGSPMQFDEYTSTARRHPPLLGEHTEEVLADLGYSTDEIERLQQEGVV